MPEQYTIAAQQNLRAIQLFYPKTNTREPALFDGNKKVVIGLDNPTPYHPVGGWEAVKSVVEHGLVPDSLIWGFECEHLHDDVYKLIPEPEFSFLNSGYDEVCGCVMVALTTTELQALDFAERRGEREKFLRRIYSIKGRDRTYDADCPKCECGIPHTSVQDN